ncbi:hypothetical protein BH10ACT3_BH10ACT3_19760 [soil metagenome]
MLVVAVASVAVVVGALFTGLAGPAAATPAAPGVAAAHAEPGDTTTTEPRDNRNLGNSITKPDQGADPVDAGDPGGWLQVSLFYLICGAIIAIAVLVWYNSRRARQRREAAGLDPVSLAKATGKGVRAPSPLAKSTKVDSPRSSPSAS